MTPRSLLERVHDALLDVELWDTVLTVPQLMHFKTELDNALMDAISDENTPCPHDGTRWPVADGERCGLCSRRIVEKENVNG